jgi:zinc protease
MSAGRVHRARLRNGLLVLLKEIRAAPLVSLWTWYRVGSRNERAGRTGISHWVEHMQFKGTPAFPAGSLDRAVSREGGV